MDCKDSEFIFQFEAMMFDPAIVLPLDRSGWSFLEGLPTVLQNERPDESSAL